MIKIFHAQNEFVFKLLEEYLLPYEKYCCTLMQKILLHEKAIYFLGDMNIGDVLQLTSAELNEAHTSDTKKTLGLIHGVILFEKGRTIFHCLPEQNSEIFDALK